MNIYQVNNLIIEMVATIFEAACILISVNAFIGFVLNASCPKDPYTLRERKERRRMRGHDKYPKHRRVLTPPRKGKRKRSSREFMIAK